MLAKKLNEIIVYFICGKEVFVVENVAYNFCIFISVGQQESNWDGFSYFFGLNILDLVFLNNLVNRYSYLFIIISNLTLLISALAGS